MLKFWNKWAYLWDPLVFKLFFPIWKRIIKEAEIQPGEKILEIGCGTGNLAIMMGLAGANVAAVDFSPKMIEVAQARTEDFIEEHMKTETWIPPTFQVADATQLSFSNESFDQVVFNSVIGDMPYDLRLKILSEAKRLTKNKIIIGDLWIPKAKILRLLWLISYPWWIIKNAKGVWSFYMHGFYEELERIHLHLSKRITHWYQFIPMSVYTIKKRA